MIRGGANVESIHRVERDYGAITVSPKGIVVIGDLSELQNNEQKRAFELFRRSLSSVDIITYDELLERAKYIIQKRQV